MNSKLLLLGVVLLAAGGALWAVFGRGNDEPIVPSPAPTDAAPAADPGQAVEPKSAASFVVNPNETAEEDRMLLPDGSWVRALNGVKNPKLAWPNDRPFPGITGTEFDKFGQEWYKIADGSRLSMKMMWRDDLGRYDGLTMLANPAQVAERRDEELAPRQDGPVLPGAGGTSRN